MSFVLMLHYTTYFSFPTLNTTSRDNSKQMHIQAKTNKDWINLEDERRQNCMDDEGIEPTTLSMRSSRSTNWARRPWYIDIYHSSYRHCILAGGLMLWLRWDSFIDTNHSWDIRLLEIHFVASNGVATLFGSDSSSGEGFLVMQTCDDHCWGGIRSKDILKK